MKKTTPQKLTKRLAQYGALSLAIAGIADASGQIVYTDVDPDSAGTSNMNNVLIKIDMDNDGIYEFDLRIKYTVSLDANPNSLITGASILGNPNGGSFDNYNYPNALSLNDTIDSSKTTWIGDSVQILVWNNCQYTGSDYNKWCDVFDRYLGLRFKIGGNTHYGWARLDVGDLPNNWILKDYAYNSVAGESIMAGEGQPLGIEDNVFTKVKIVALNKSIALFNLPQQTNYRLFSITGQSVLDGKITNNTHVIEVNTLASGIYIIELKDNTSNAVIRKKIVL